MEEGIRPWVSWMRKALTVALCCVCAMASLAGAPQKAYAMGYYATVNGQSLSGEIDINDILNYGIVFYTDAETYWRWTDFFIYEDGGLLSVGSLSSEAVDGIVYSTIFAAFSPGHSYTLAFTGRDGTNSSAPIVWEQSFAFGTGGSPLVEEPDESEDQGGGAPDPEGPEGSGLGGDGLEEGSGGMPDIDDGLSENELWEGYDEALLPDGSGDPYETSPEVFATDLYETEAAVPPESTASHQSINADERPTSEADATWEAESRPEGFDSTTQLAFTGDARSGMTGSELLSKGSVFGLATMKGLSDNSDANTADAIDLTILGIPYAMLALLAILFGSLPFGFAKRYGSFKLALARTSRWA